MDLANERWIWLVRDGSGGYSDGIIYREEMREGRDAWTARRGAGALVLFKVPWPPDILAVHVRKGVRSIDKRQMGFLVFSSVIFSPHPTADDDCRRWPPGAVFTVYVSRRD